MRRIWVLLVVVPFLAGWGNTPCSQSKRGINHCEGTRFICNDGSVSASKKDCRSYFGGAGASGLDTTAEPLDEPEAADAGAVSGKLRRPKGGKP